MNLELSSTYHIYQPECWFNWLERQGFHHVRYKKAGSKDSKLDSEMEFYLLSHSSNECTMLKIIKKIALRISAKLS